MQKTSGLTCRNLEAPCRKRWSGRTAPGLSSSWTSPCLTRSSMFSWSRDIKREKKRARESVIDPRAIITLCKSVKLMNSCYRTKPTCECHLGKVPIWQDKSVTDRYHQLLINSPVLPTDTEALMISRQIITMKKQTPLGKNITGGDWLGDLIAMKLPAPKKYKKKKESSIWQLGYIHNLLRICTN